MCPKMEQNHFLFFIIIPLSQINIYAAVRGGAKMECIQYKIERSIKVRECLQLVSDTL